ncbi:MAG: hypothetical protein M5R42_21565 [Rhodocyclaceae bacterium]|nr:hypothetical protein [Rhodocyclaceae bacterium]
MLGSDAGAACRETVDGEFARQHAQFGIRIGNVPPAGGAHVPHLDEFGFHQRRHPVRLEKQVRARVAPTVFREYQIGDLLGVSHGVAPSLQAGFAEGLHALRVIGNLLRRSEQVVAVEIDPRRAWREFEMTEATLLEEEGLVRAVGGHDVCAAVNRILVVEAVRQDDEAVSFKPSLRRKA